MAYNTHLYSVADVDADHVRHRIAQARRCHAGQPQFGAKSQIDLLTRRDLGGKGSDRCHAGV